MMSERHFIKGLKFILVGLIVVMLSGCSDKNIASSVSSNEHVSITAGPSVEIQEQMGRNTDIDEMEQIKLDIMRDIKELVIDDLYNEIKNEVTEKVVRELKDDIKEAVAELTSKKPDDEDVLRFPFTYQYASRAEIDLDGDLEREDIEISGDGAILFINNRYNRIIEEDLVFPRAEFTIIDIDVNDSYKEILLTGMNTGDSMPSYFDVIFRYKNGELICMGTIFAGLGGDTLYYDGHGQMYQEVDADVHESNVMTVQYFVNEDDKIERIYSDEGYYYPSYNKHACKLLERLPVRAERSLDLETYMIEPQIVRFRRTDGEYWVEVVAEDGTIGWMYIDPGYKVWDLDNKFAGDVFEGLWYAG